LLRPDKIGARIDEREKSLSISLFRREKLYKSDGESLKRGKESGGRKPLPKDIFPPLLEGEGD
jgi:hypothetical protein